METITDSWLTEQFYQAFGAGTGTGTGTSTVHHFYAPGRVNLIGEYTDFNGGLVLPCGIDRGIHLLIRQTTGHHAEFASGNLPYTARIDLKQTLARNGKEWTNYPVGVLQEFVKNGCELDGMQLYFYGDLPDGAGLSSSAAIEVVTAYAINTLYSLQQSKIDLALLSQQAEINFNDVQCGIMDQFAVAMARADHAIALNCDTLEYTHVPLDLGDYQLLISHTGQRRELADGAYNERVKECNAAVALLKPLTGATCLADISPEALETHGHILSDQLIRRRATHVITEHNRVKMADERLRNNDLTGFGTLMVESHQSLRDNFNVSSGPLDTMVDLALASDGVLGSRMTGAGFGGCTITLIHKDAIDNMIERITPVYVRKTQLQPAFYITSAAAGVREMTGEQ